MNTIDVQKLRMNFGSFAAVSDLSLTVPTGTAMALLGENGAGKTTTLRILAGIYQATSGTGTILDTPLGSLDTPQFQRIGHVSENQHLPLHWTLQQLIDYLKPLYPNWDDAFCEELIENFELPRDRKLGAMSRGMQMKASLVSSLAYRPDLLLLDEPFSGLDPLVREELIDGILELMQGGDWTILLSSHDINEVERLCDSVTLIRDGKIDLSEDLDHLQERFRRWTIHNATSPDSPFPPEWIQIEQLSDTSWTFTDTQHHPEQSPQKIATLFGTTANSEATSLSLRDIYLTIARQQKKTRLAQKKSA
ncbi:MAG: ABC transporter ATP-binding protein [Verrucomicrobiaceae bacterium]